MIRRVVWGILDVWRRIHDVPGRPWVAVVVVPGVVRAHHSRAVIVAGAVRAAGPRARAVVAAAHTRPADSRIAAGCVIARRIVLGFRRIIIGGRHLVDDLLKPRIQRDRQLAGGLLLLRLGPLGVILLSLRR